MMNIIVITVLLVISTILALRQMRKVFGPQSVSEEKTIWALLLIFCGTYVLRVIITLIIYFFSVKVSNFFDNSHTYFQFSVFILWLIWDTIPLMSMMYTHYRNFSSFSNEEILYTEYSVDDSRSSEYLPFDGDSMSH